MLSSSVLRGRRGARLSSLLATAASQCRRGNTLAATQGLESVVEDTKASSSAESQGAASPQEVHAGTQRHISLVQLPEYMDGALEAMATVGSIKQMRQHGVELQKQLRRTSRTTVKGGVEEYPALERDTGLRQRPPKRSELRTVRLKEFENASFEQLEIQYKAMGAVASAMKPKQRKAMELMGAAPQRGAEAGPKYIEESVAAYAANRLPSTYSAVYRVMSELKAVTGDTFTPKRMLDYGSGPGTAVWAAQEVYGNSVRDVLAVEPSEAMTSLGEVLNDARQASSPQATPLRWLRKLPGFNKVLASTADKRTWRGMPKFDMVVASYVLTELRSAKERLALVEGLWELTDDVLVLVEPGTPVGSANCREARAKLLGIAGDDGRAGGAHVLAPCTHDGRCPLDGTKHWCHFVQRHQRPRTQRQAKATPNRKRPRDYQDEKFSYVILRRGPRPATSVDLSLVHRLEPTGEATGPGPGNASPIEIDEETRRVMLEALLADAESEEEAEAVTAALEKKLREVAADGTETSSSGIEESVAEQPPGESSSLKSQQPEPLKGPPVVAYEDQFASLDSDSDSGSDSGSDSQEEAASPEAVAQLRRHSSGWARIIRAPRKRRKHVVLDLCSPGEGGRPPAMQQVTISKSFDSYFSSPGPYFSARRVRWGDAWPLVHRSKK